MHTQIATLEAGVLDHQGKIEELVAKLQNCENEKKEYEEPPVCSTPGSSQQVAMKQRFGKKKEHGMAGDDHEYLP